MSVILICIRAVQKKSKCLMSHLALTGHKCQSEVQELLGHLHLREWHPVGNNAKAAHILVSKQ